ncbi:HNH endonuclease [Mesorhizobium sp. YIM 152430]|uniref:HNH endonuclease n=1 Tax=Mesorhizobium sp. YIM 152430 TaxID=3031761 RepID=UPI0023DBA9E6|nr:HNH endonuclease [Mesorhizobium sp. YIM 152430]MDF1599672.1 HNH endonuclease [Mesorhizobium sp. YIM 152430]
MPRAVKEWIGKTPDSKVPPRVRLRILRAYDGCCYLSGRPIAPGEPWELEHKVALILGGEHRESNLAPALAEFHKAKTDAVAKKHLRIVDDGPKMQGQPFATTKTRAEKKAKAADKLPLPARQRPLYRAAR